MVKYKIELNIIQKRHLNPEMCNKGDNKNVFIPFIFCEFALLLSCLFFKKLQKLGEKSTKSIDLIRGISECAHKYCLAYQNVKFEIHKLLTISFLGDQKPCSFPFYYDFSSNRCLEC